MSGDNATHLTVNMGLKSLGVILHCWGYGKDRISKDWKGSQVSHRIRKGKVE